MSKKSWLYCSIFAGILAFIQLFNILQLSPVTAQTQRINLAISQQSGVANAAQWLITTHQNDDGGYAAFSGMANLAPSNANGTLDATIALGMAGYDPNVPLFGESAAPGVWLRQNADAVAAYASQNGGSAGKAILGVYAANQDARDFGGYNLVISLTAQLSPTGQYNVNAAYNQALALLALSAASEPIPPSSVNWLLSKQAADGSWDDGFGTMKNPDATAMSMMALRSAGLPITHSRLLSATHFLGQAQLATGGFEYGVGFGENANSSGLVAQALSAMGEDFFSTGGAWDKGSGATPLSALASYQGATGAFQADFGAGLNDDFYTTIQGMPALTGRPYPQPNRLLAAQKGVACLAGLQDQATGGWEQFATIGVNAAGTSRAIQAIAAIGDDPNSAPYITVGGVTPIQALENMTPSYLAGGRGGRLGIVMQGVVAGNGNPTNFAGGNLPISMTAYLSPTGAYDNIPFGVFPHAEAMLGLQAAGAPVDPTATTFLLAAASNGDWGTPDDNGIAIQALGLLSPPAVNASLMTSQLADGGWGLALPSSPNSTAEVIQGLAAIGEHPNAPQWSVVVSGTMVSPQELLISQQLPTGCWAAFGGGDGAFATTDAILGLMAQPIQLYHLNLPYVVK